MTISNVATRPFDDQKPGTSGLRKKVTHFQQENYLENFVQSIFDSLSERSGQTLVLGGDGRYFNREACSIILRMAAANGFAKVIVGQDGLLSTPAVSLLIRKRQAFGGIILSASHNPGGPDGDFGIKFNAANGGPAQESLTEHFFKRSTELTNYSISNEPAPRLDQLGEFDLAGMRVEVVDPVSDYADLMAELFDFDAIRKLFSDGFEIRFDAMHAITGPYAMEVLVNRLGANPNWVINAKPDESFGGGHPDPNLVHAKAIYDLAMKEDGPDLCAASDGDGDRNLIIGKSCFVAPSDSLAVIAANAHLVPAYSAGLKGVARSMPTSGAVDRVAQVKGLKLYETPTGWKFFGNLLDSGDISLCGEESAGTGSNHVREKDGLWAVLMWLNILAVRKTSVQALMNDHWKTYGRNYYVRYDFEEVDTAAAEAVMEEIRTRSNKLAGETLQAGLVKNADEFSYTDPVDGSVSTGQGLRVLYHDGSRIIYRLSGTGTVGATLRVYIERYVDESGELNMSSDEALADLIEDAYTLARIAELTGRTTPDVVT